MDRIKIDTANPDYSLLRQVLLRRLRQGWQGQIDHDLKGFEDYVDLDPPRSNDHEEFLRLQVDVFWELVTEGIVVPGNGPAQPNLPWFRVTPYGRRVLESTQYEPYDPTGYVASLQQRIGSTVDLTVLAYIDESLQTFVRGRTVAAMVMLGVAAERVFDLLCESLVNALGNAAEKQKFSALLNRFAMKPKVDWVHAKLREVQDRKPKNEGFPENSALMVTAIYDIMRAQRNDLGHPREMPPKLSPGDAHANLLIFPRYYETAELVRKYLASSMV
jgi:hypothetical protein